MQKVSEAELIEVVGARLQSPWATGVRLRVATLNP